MPIRGTSMKSHDIDMYIKSLGDYDTGVRVELTLPPESIDESYSANFNTASMQGRSTPIHGYGDGGPKTVSFTVKLHDDFIDSGGKDIVDIVNEIKSLSYPVYRNRVIPPRVLVKLGSMIEMTAVCTSVGVNWQLPYGQTQSGRVSYLHADISLSFDEVRSIAPSATEIIREG